MKTIVLDALNESHFPMSAMAAFGLLQVLTFSEPQKDPSLWPRLSWKRSPQWTAVLHTCLDENELVKFLVKTASSVKDHPVWTAADDMRKDFDPSKFLYLLQQHSEHYRHEALVSGFASEWPLSRNGQLILTSFYMISGQQKFLDTIRAAANLSLDDESSEEYVREALFGPWRYRDQLSSMGWDPATERYYALEAQAPTKSKPRTVRIALWLAAESLALFPCYGVGKRVETQGINASAFYWPVWEMPISYYALRSLFTFPLYDTKKKDELIKRGVSAVFSSQRGAGAAGRGYFSFRPANLVWQKGDADL